MAYLIPGSAGDVVTDRDSVDRWDSQICSDSGGASVQFGLYFY